MMGLGYTLTLVMVGTFLLGILGGLLGSTLVLRRQALMGDALSHATLPGVMLTFLWVGTRSLDGLLLGALLSAGVAYLLMNVIKKQSFFHWDATMALLLAGFFGFGQWVLSIIQRQGSAAQAGLSRFIFGQAATMLRADVERMVLVSVILIIVLMVVLKEIKMYVFDDVFFASLGYKTRPMDVLLGLMTLIFILLGIRMVGVVLISALLIAPALIARQWTQRFQRMLLLAALSGGFSGAIGTYLSATTANIPTGPVIVFVLGVVFIVSFLFAPKEGVLVRSIESIKLKRMIQKYQTLIHLYEQQDLVGKTSQISHYEASGWVYYDQSLWRLTDQGKAKVQALKRVILDEH